MNIPGTVPPPGYSLWLCLYIYISPLGGVAQTPDCGMFVISFSYKPFMWRRSDARLWQVRYFIYLQALYVVSLRRPTVACLLFYLLHKPFMWCRWDARLWHCLLFIYFISPLCGVAEMPDCGMLINHILYKPFMCCHTDARLRHFISTPLLHIHVAYK